MAVTIEHHVGDAQGGGVHLVETRLCVSDERPDALIIRDDNLVEHATAGLGAAGVRVPDDLERRRPRELSLADAHAVPVCRLGYDIRQLFEICIEGVEGLRRGEHVPRLTHLPALFEEELATNKSASGAVPANHVILKGSVRV